MKVVCINKNGWHEFNGNAYAFLEPRMELIGYPEYGQEYFVKSTFLDCHGDLLYIVKEYGDVGLDADAFALVELMNIELEARECDASKAK